MAAKNCSVILGFIDEQVSSRTQQQVDHTTNKIGGLPNWPEKSTIPICKKCGRKQSLVFQIYAPLENSLYHRTLYIFACVTQECWNRPHSWTCWRSQALAAKTKSPDSSTNTPTSSVNISDEKWFEDDDDWGDNLNDDGNGNTDNFAFTSSYLDNIMQSRGGNLNHRNVNKQISVNSVARKMECHLNISKPKEDDNANEAICGAMGVEGMVDGVGEEASAILEGPEGDMISVDTPEHPTTDIPSLFKAAYKVDANVDAVFVSHFVSTGLESYENTDFTEHERELLLHYTHSTGHELMEEDMCVDGKGGCDGVYEKDSVTHGDLFIHKFNKRVSRDPSQILRYCRDAAYLPLWLYQPSPGDLGGKCSYCKGPLICEAQVMPQLVQILRLTGIKEVSLEFGTVVIYTCATSCWKEGDSPRQEVCLVQCEVI